MRQQYRRPSPTERVMEPKDTVWGSVDDECLSLIDLHKKAAKAKQGARSTVCGRIAKDWNVELHTAEDVIHLANLPFQSDNSNEPNMLKELEKEALMASRRPGGGVALRLTFSRLLLAALLANILVMIWRAHSTPKTSPERMILPNNTPQGHKNTLPDVEAVPMLPLEEAEMLCSQHGLNPYPDRSRRRKVYDLFLVGTELDWTEIRLNELARHVDYFVVVEAERTFTPNLKPKFFKKNWQHFSKFESQIIYHVLNDDFIRGDTNPWSREKYQRNAMMTQVFPSILGDKAPEIGDVVMVSDVDEIPRPETIEKLRNCDIPLRTGLQSQFFLYLFQLRRTDMDWYHPQATTWQGEKTILPESLRMEGTTFQFPNASWHCTTCFSTIDEMVKKIKSFSHQEYNKPEYTDPDRIVVRVRNGSDVFDRDYPYQRLEIGEIDAPQYLLQHKDKFWYLLDRDAPNGNFKDYSPSVEADSYDRSESDDLRAPKLEGS